MSKSLSVLIIDDEVNVLETLYYLMSDIRPGDTFYKSTSAVAAIKMIRDEKRSFDIIISDINMPEMSGIEFAKLVKELQPKTRLFLVSGNISIVEQLKLFDIGVEKVFSKPVKMEDLFSAIESPTQTSNLLISNMVALNIEALQLKQSCSFDVYVGLSTNKAVKIFNKNTELDQGRIAQFIENGIQHLYANDDANLLNNLKLYVPVRTSNFKENIILDFSVYYLANVEYFELIPANTLITSKMLDVAKSRNLKKLFIVDQDEPKFLRYLDSILEHLMNSKTISGEDKAATSFNYLGSKVKETLINPSNNNIIALGKSQKHLQTFLKNDLGAIAKLVKLNENSKGVHIHSAMVASLSYAIILEIIRMREDDNLRLKIKVLDEYIFESDEVREIIFTGALLHDIGKSILGIDETIITANEAIKNEEIDAKLSNHPRIAFELLSKLKTINSKSLEIVMQSGEFCDGSGSPNKLTKTQISFYSQVVILANYFDEKRENGKKSSPEVLEIIIENISKFNKYLIPVLERVIKA